MGDLWTNETFKWQINSEGKFAFRDEYELGAYGYGKNNVKLLYVRRSDELRHEIREYEVDTHLRLSSQRDYLEGDNRDIIATDSQKNTVYLMAKKHGIHSPEAFALLLCSHFLYMYEQVAEVSITVEEYPWARYHVDNRPHNHAFIMCPTATRFCQVSQLRNGTAPRDITVRRRLIPESENVETVARVD